MIEAKGLEKRNGEFIAVDNISFVVKEREVFGMDISADQRKINRLLGVVPQESKLDPDLDELKSNGNLSDSQILLKAF